MDLKNKLAKEAEEAKKQQTKKILSKLLISINHNANKIILIINFFNFIIEMI